MFLLFTIFSVVLSDMPYVLLLQCFTLKANLSGKPLSPNVR